MSKVGVAFSYLKGWEPLFATIFFAWQMFCTAHGCTSPFYLGIQKLVGVAGWTPADAIVDPQTAVTTGLALLALWRYLVNTVAQLRRGIPVQDLHQSDAPSHLDN